MTEPIAFWPVFEQSGRPFRHLSLADRGKLDEMLRDRVALRRLRRETDQDIAELQRATIWLAERTDQSLPTDASSEWIVKASKQAEEKERQVVAHYLPVIELLRTALVTPNDTFEADVQQLLRDGIELLDGWLIFYRGLHAMLSRQAAEWRAQTKKALRAKPTEGEVDWAELSREHIARYPKIRARLAE